MRPAIGAPRVSDQFGHRLDPPLDKVLRSPVQIGNRGA